MIASLQSDGVEALSGDGELKEYFEVLHSYPVHDASVLPAYIRATCEGKPTYWVARASKDEGQWHFPNCKHDLTMAFSLNEIYILLSEPNGNVN